MKKDTRLDEIVKICEKSGTVTISSLARSLGVSEITIRRDLSLLENLRLVRRKKKGVSAQESQSIHDLLNYHIEEEYNKKTEQKMRIAKKAVNMIKPGETVIFDSGSTLYYLIQALPENIPIRAVCYGLQIAHMLNKKRLLQLILIGGSYQKEMDMFESFTNEEVLKSIRAQKAFISAFGIHKQAGLTSGSFFASSIRKKIISSSEKVYVLADSSKFGVIEHAHFADLHEIDTVITDSGINEEYVKLFQSMNITIITA